MLLLNVPHHHRVHDHSQMTLVGDVHDSDVIIVDDMVDTGSRLRLAARTCKQHGANRVYAYSTHGLLSRLEFDADLDNSDISELVLTNTIAKPDVCASTIDQHLIIHQSFCEIPSTRPTILQKQTTCVELPFNHYEMAIMIFFDCLDVLLRLSCVAARAFEEGTLRLGSVDACRYDLASALRDATQSLPCRLPVQLAIQSMPGPFPSEIVIHLLVGIIWRLNWNG